MTKKIKLIKKSLNETYQKAYDRGIIDAMSTAVNIYNCPEYIREGVFKSFKIK